MSKIPAQSRRLLTAHTPSKNLMFISVSAKRWPDLCAQRCILLQCACFLASAYQLRGELKKGAANALVSLVTGKALLPDYKRWPQTLSA